MRQSLLMMANLSVRGTFNYPKSTLIFLAFVVFTSFL